MRIEALVADAFGPFIGRTFEFAPGFNLVYGPNEAGKSSLHAALYAAIGGVRRGRGRSTAEHEFDRYRPWDHDGPWRVRVRLELADGRRVEVLQDLGDKPRSRAVDVELGRDCTAEILPKEGTPDASRWLGLDRRAFLATACVRQAELLRVRDEPAALQEHLQRAAATSGADATAAEALARLDAFLREQVGAKQVNSTKPLRQAMDRFDAARAELDRARAAHAGYLELLAREEELVASQGEAERRWAVARAARLLAEAQAARRNLERVREIAEQHPQGSPTGLVEDDDLAREVERVLAAEGARPRPTELEGDPADALRTALSAVDQEMRTLVRASAGVAAPASEGTRSPAVPSASGGSGDDSEVREAVERVLTARRFVDEHASRRPPDPIAVDAGGASAEELRTLADVLSRPEPRADSEVEAARARSARRQARLRRAGWIAIAAGAVAAGIGIVAGRDPSPRPAALEYGLYVAAALVLGGILCLARARPRGISALEVELRLRHEAWSAERDRANNAVRGRGLSSDPVALRAAADGWVLWDRARSRLADWDETDRSLRTDLATVENDLRAVLEARGIPSGPDPLTDARDFERLRVLQARRHEVEGRLVRREREEQAYDQAKRDRLEVEAGLARVALRCGVEAGDPEACRAGLESWRVARRRALERHEESLREWGELERVLAGRTIEELAGETERLESRARERMASLDPREVLATPSDDAELASREGAARRAESELDQHRVEIRLRGAVVPRVAEAEEALREAEQELERVQRLESTLVTARDFLRRAQDRAHRDVAPILATSVREALSQVTTGRYDDVRIDPESLAVQVHERRGDWRDTDALSHGTSEQIYLLLRLAMARHLVRRGEQSPILLDDVTVQFDRERKRAVLETLRHASAERQVLLLTQEDDVLEWAQANLKSPHDAIIRLEPPR